jgi:hypothetical protein
MFGLGTGSIELRLPKTAYQAGEEISGTLLLNVKNPAKARGLYVKIYAEQKVREMRSSGSGKMRPVETTRKLYEYQIELDKEREYPKTNGAVSYPFKFVVPEGARSGHAAEKPMDGTDLLISAIRLGTGVGPLGPVKWYLEGFLDLPMAFDVSAKMQLDI